MFQRLIDDLKDSTSRILRLTSLVIAAALALFITMSFLCAAAFIVVLDRYGVIEACLAGAGIFFVVTLIAAGGYVMRKNQIKARAREPAKSALHTALTDPMLVTAGVQIIRAIGIKKLIPLLAVGGLALGLLASRNPSSDEAPAE